MARTKQTACQSTGDIAPRMTLVSAGKMAPKPDVVAAGSVARPVEPNNKRPGSPSVMANPKRPKMTAGPKSVNSKTPVSKPTARMASATAACGNAKNQTPSASPPTVATNATTAPSQPVVELGPQPTITVPEVEPVVVHDFSNAFCYMCQNGGDSIACDECERILCLKHVPQIAAVPEKTRVKLHFHCPSCHALRTQGAEHKDMCTPYHGLYKVARDGKLGKPHIPGFVTVDSKGARHLHAQVDTRPIVILSVRLTSLDEDTSPAWFLAKYLTPWFCDPAASNLRYIDLPFDIDCLETAEAYHDAWDQALSALGVLKNSRLLVFVYTHSHDETGDLFFAPKICAESVDDWWPNVMPRRLADIARSRNNELTIAMLACGALITRDDLRKQLMAHADKFGAKRVFAFAAPQLQAVVTIPFFMNFAQRVLLEHTDLNDDNVGTVLEHSVLLAQHTPIWMFSRKLVSVPFQVNVYQWTHTTMRPFGIDIGIQCPGCGSLASRKGSESGDGSSIKVRCTKPQCQWSKVFIAPNKVMRLKLGEKGHWTNRRVED